MKHILIILVVFNLSILWGQKNDEIVVTAAGGRKVEKAYRPDEKPKILDTLFPAPQIEHPLLAVKHESVIELSQIKPATINVTNKLNQLYNTYVKLGIGSPLTPLAEVYFNNTRTRKYQYGVHAKHFSNFGRIKNYAPSQFDRTAILAYGGINEEKYSLLGELSYSNRGLHFYGLRVPKDSIHKDSIRQRYQEIGADFQFKSKRADSATLNYTVGLNYTHFFNQKPIEKSLSKRQVQENYFNLIGKGTYKYGNELFGVELGVKYNGYKYGFTDTTVSKIDTALKQNNTIIHLYPSVETSLWKNRFKANIGVNILLDINEKTKVHIYPMAEVKYALLNNMFIPYLGVRGGMNQNSFRTMTYTNEFISSQQQLRNENTAIAVYGGFKGTLSKTISFNIGASYGRIQNLALFVQDTVYSRGNQFKVIYDTASIATVEGSISYQLNEKIKIDAIAKYHSYELKNQSYAWNLPQVEGLIRGSYNLFDKFILNVDITMQGGRRTLVYDSLSSDHYENLQYSKKLGFLFDANLGVEYRYNKRISAFIQFNNIAAQKYQRWINYPVMGFQVLGGLTFRF